MTRQTNDSPYAEEHQPRPLPSRERTTHKPRRPVRGRGAQAASAEAPAQKSRQRADLHAERPRAHQPAREKAEPATPKRRRRGRAGAYAAPAQLTSVPTSRNAYVETRMWLLEQHGPVCAYCGKEHPERLITLDHVTPRRGLTAYDRRDNLVLACQPCNSAKRDLAPLAFLLASRTRAVHLLRYGSHLSPMLVDLARSLAPEHLIASVMAAEVEDELGDWGMLDDGESPYAD